MAIPTMNAVNGREPTPGFQPRSSWKDTGYYKTLDTLGLPSELEIIMRFLPLQTADKLFWQGELASQ